MGAKKEPSPSEIVEDLIVKLKNIYKDVYIFRNTFCVPGKDTPNSVVGDIMCILEPKYKDAITCLFKNTECIYIPSVGDFRDILKIFNNDKESQDQYIETTNKMRENGELVYFSGAVIESPEKITDCLDFVTLFEDKFNDDKRTWTCIGDNEELIKTIYTDRAIFNLPIEDTKKEDNSYEYITIAKQLLPLITEKTISNAFLNVMKSKDYPDLYEVLIDFRFTHFQMEGLYNIIPIPFL